MIKARDAIRVARSLIGTPYSTLDCINLIKKVIRTAPGGVPGYTTAGTNSLWDSFDMSTKYRDLLWRQRGISGASAGMIAFKISGEDVHHAGIVTEAGTVVHASSIYGETVETPLDSSWHALAVHRYIETAAEQEENMESYKAKIRLNDPESSVNVRNGPSTGNRKIGVLHHGAPVTVQAETGDWRYITYGDSGVGYVHQDYVERVEDDEEDKPVEIDGVEPVQKMHEFTTLMKDDGTTIRLEGVWRVAED